jgi:alkanesulfonate monooxygenase SsuD/methylene tetrahydromethanopterin reductase-like flavin-dependent oxidoreductase (luciferase family)
VIPAVPDDLPDLGVCLAVPPLRLSEHRRLAAAAEEAGSAVLGVGEARHDSLAVAAMLICATNRVPVMTAVTTWARSPVSAAVGALTLAEMCQGRFTLGLGTMPAAWNRDFHGIDPTRPLARLREYVAVLRAASLAWAGSPAHFSGEFFSVDGYGTDRADSPGYEVPVHLAATRPAMARLAAEIGDGVIVNVVHTRRWLRERILPALAEGDALSGRRAHRTVMLRVCVHDGSVAGRSEAMSEAAASLNRYRQVPYFREIAAAEGLDPDRLDHADIVTRFVAVGTVDEIRKRLATYRGGFDAVLLTPASGLTLQRESRTYEAILTMVGRRARALRGDGPHASRQPVEPGRP